MRSLRKAAIAALINSLIHGKSLFEAIQAYWATPLSAQDTATIPEKSSLERFLKDAEAAFLGPIDNDGLLKLSDQLNEQFLEALQSHMECMLPSYSHQLPTGRENGHFIALDVGGSTLRVALVRLGGPAASGDDDCDIVGMRSFKIDKAVKDLEGMAFFNWMAKMIARTLRSDFQETLPEGCIPLSLAWSFPIEQTSMGGGKLQPMGKAFLADKGLLGQDLGQIIKKACKTQNLDVDLKALLNDSDACLLSQAYSYPTTRFGLILGTGLNMAAYMPVSSMSLPKFGERPSGWFHTANHVIVNTEMSMFGTGVLPLTRWDKGLNKNHSRPGFQPMEYMVSGMYLGEIARLAIVEAIATSGLLAGVLPESLKTAYALNSETLSRIESDTSEDLTESIKIFSERHPSPHTPTVADMQAIRSLASFISTRSSALVATCVYTLWKARLQSEQKFLDTLEVCSPVHMAVKADMNLENTTVAFNGSVIENYSGHRDRCQKYIAQLLDTGAYAQGRSIELVPAGESSLLGAAVALACVEHST